MTKQGSVPVHSRRRETGQRKKGVHGSEFLTSDGIWNFLKNMRNSTVFFAVKLPGIPYVFAYGIPHVTNIGKYTLHTYGM